MSENHIYCGFKLRSGETIFAELLSEEDTSYVIKEPILIKQNLSDVGLEMLVFPFADYAKTNTHKLSASHVYMMDLLSAEYIKYYGKAIMGMKLSKIKNQTYDFLVGDIEEDYFKISEMLNTIRKEAKYYVEKFNIDEPDFSDMEKKLEGFRPTLQ